MKTTKPMAQLIQMQIQSLNEEEEAAKQATIRRAKQRAQLLAIYNAVECEDLHATGIRARALTHAKNQQ